MQLSDYLTELVYAAAGALLGFLLMKTDDVLNNKQYTTKEYNKFTLGCYLATLSGLLLLRFAGPVRFPSSDATSNIIRPIVTNQLGGSSTNHTITSQFTKPPTIPSGSTAFFQPANGSNSLRFTAGTPTF